MLKYSITCDAWANTIALTCICEICKHHGRPHCAVLSWIPPVSPWSIVTNSQSLSSAEICFLHFPQFLCSISFSHREHFVGLFYRWIVIPSTGLKIITICCCDAGSKMTVCQTVIFSWNLCFWPPGTSSHNGSSAGGKKQNFREKRHFANCLFWLVPGGRSINQEKSQQQVVTILKPVNGITIQR